MQAHRANLGDAVVLGGKAGGLQVEADEIPGQGLLAAAGHGGHQVIDKVGLCAVEHLELRVLLADGLHGVHGLWESLCHAVVGDGHGLLAPLVGLLDKGGGRGHAVHVGHAGVQVQLHPLLQGVVHHLYQLHRGDGPGAHDVFPVVLVVLHLPADQQSRARLELIQSLALPGVLDDLQGGGAGVVGDVDGVDFPGFVPGLLALHGENLPPDHQAAHIQGGLPQGGDFAPGHLAQHGLGRLWDDGGQQVLLVPHADLPAAGPLLQSLLVLLHLPDLGLPLAADLLVAGLLHQGALSGVHREPARELHRAGDLEPLLDKAFQLGAGVPGGQKLIAAVGQVDGELAALVDGLRLVEGAV